MIANVAALRSRRPLQRGRSAVPAVPQRRSRSDASLPPLSPRLQLIRAALVLVCVTSVAFLLQLTIVSGFQQSAAQSRAFDDFRERLALSTAPIGPVDAEGRLLAEGTPVAYLEIRSLGLEQVVGEGTTSTVLFDGPGHRRDTPLPGQAGLSVLFGRKTTYGGPFGNISDLRVDDIITVTTGQGIFDFRVFGIRVEGQPAPPPPAAGTSRLMLVTSAGNWLWPNGVLRVDAELVGAAVVGPARAISAAGLPDEERAMAADSRTLWVLALWLQALIVLSVAAAWAWHRWGRAQAWVVCLPPLMLVGLSVAGEAARLLPNLL
jgi:sortase A